MRVVDARGRVGRVVFAASFDGNEDGTRGKRETTRCRACFSFAVVAVARACGRDAVCRPALCSVDISRHAAGRQQDPAPRQLFFIKKKLNCRG